MPVRVEQTAEMSPGFARLVFPGFDKLAAETTEIRISRIDLGSPQFLDPRFAGSKAWGAAECWFRPDGQVGGAGSTGVDLGPAATWHLKPHTPYLISFRDGSGTTIDERMSWPAIRLPSEAPPPRQPETVMPDPSATQDPDPIRETEPVETVAPEAETEEPPTQFVATAADKHIEAPDSTEPQIAEKESPSERTRGRVFLIAGLLLLVVGAVGAYFGFVDPGYLNREPPTEVSNGDPPATTKSDQPETTLLGARTYLKKQPDADAAAEQAERFAEAGRNDAAFLIRSYAARGGNADAALRLGDLYNPATWTEGVLKAPDPDRAAQYYRQAAEAGMPEAMKKLSTLLMTGQVAVEDAPEQAEFWRRRAEEAQASETKETE